MDRMNETGTPLVPTEVPTEQDSQLAADALRALATATAASQDELRVRLDDGRHFTLPGSATRLLSHILNEIASGNAVTVIPIHAELTTQEAADYLNVSRPFLIRLLEEGKIPFHKVGTHRRVKFRDLEDHRRATEAKRREVMDELAAQAQEFGMGY